MPFNPTLPANGSQILSAELREQFTSLKALIDDLTARVAALETENDAQDATIAAWQTQFTNLEDGTSAQFAQVNADIADRVTTGTFNDGMSDTPRNVNGVGIIGIGVDDPPSQSQVQAISDKVDELITGLHR